MHIFDAVLLVFIFQTDSEGQYQSQNILHAHPVRLQLDLNKNISQHGDSQKPEDRTRDSSMNVTYVKYIPSNNSN
jgi:hypothetical protein